MVGWLVMVQTVHVIAGNYVAINCAEKDSFGGTLLLL